MSQENPNNNHDQMRKIRETLAHHKILNSNEGYSDPATFSLEQLCKAHMRLSAEQVQVEITPTSVLEQMLKEIQMIRQIPLYELENGHIDMTEFDKTNQFIDEAKQYMENIISLRQQFAYLHPEKWAATNTIYDWSMFKPTNEKQAVEGKRFGLEQRWLADDKLKQLAEANRLNKLNDN